MINSNEPEETIVLIGVISFLFLFAGFKIYFSSACVFLDPPQSVVVSLLREWSLFTGEELVQIGVA